VARRITMLTTGVIARMRNFMAIATLTGQVHLTIASPSLGMPGSLPGASSHTSPKSRPHTHSLQQKLNIWPLLM
jgi:hypothetical protein